MVSEFEAYVGPRPFEEKDKDIFFGRDREVRDLLNIVIAHSLVLVYAQSGAGKTSLINARLIPLLKKENQFEVLPVARVKGTILENIRTDEISNIYIFNTLTSLAKDEYDVKRLAKMKLVDFLNEQERMQDEDGMPLPRAVIIDQSEEIFSFYQDRWKDREGFFEQVSDALEADPLLRVVFVMREEFIAQLEPYENLLPEKLRTRFHMERLRREAALLAIKEPVKKAGRSFAEGVAEKLVDDLLKIRVETKPGEIAEVTGEFIEAVQLQVVCQSLWKELLSHEKQITFQHLKTYGNVEQVLYKFYEEAILAAAEEAGIDEEGLRRLCGKVLITEMGTRGMVYRAQELTGGVPNAAIDVLADMHLIRAEPRAGALWYELTHDRFIKPIQDSNKVFNDKLAEKQREEKERAEREWADKELAAERERAEKKLAEERERAEKKLTEERERAEKERLEKELRAEKERVEKERVENELQVEKEKAESRRSTIKILAIASILCLILSGVAATKWYQADQNEKEARASKLNAKSQNLQKSPTTLDKSVLLAIESLNISEKLGDNKAHQELLLDNDKLIRQGLLFIPHIIAVLKHGGEVRNVVFSPDGKYVATASDDNTSLILNASTGEQVFILNHDDWVWSAVFSPDGKYIATASGDNTSRVWDAATGKQIFVLNHAGPVYKVVFSPDGKYIATASGDNTACVWDAATGKQIFVLNHDRWVNNVTFSPDGKYIATASGDNTARVWDAATGKQIFYPLEHDAEVWTIVFSPDGKYVATASKDNTARLWNAATGKQVFVLNHDNWVYNVVFSPDEKYVATASWNNARVWDVATGNQTLALNHKGSVNNVSFSPDGKYIATASDDKTSRLWDATTGKQVFVLNHDAEVWTIVFSPDRKYIATASDDKTACVWDADTGRKKFVLNHDGPVYDVVFNPNGIHVATASGDYTACVWDVTTEDLINEARNRTRNLTPEGWKKYMGDEPYHKTFPEPIPKFKITLPYIDL